MRVYGTTLFLFSYRNLGQKTQKKNSVCGMRTKNCVKRTHPKKLKKFAKIIDY